MRNRSDAIPVLSKHLALIQSQTVLPTWLKQLMEV